MSIVHEPAALDTRNSAGLTFRFRAALIRCAFLLSTIRCRLGLNRDLDDLVKFVTRRRRTFHGFQSVALRFRRGVGSRAGRGDQ